MAKYYNISLDEMRDFLKFEKGWVEEIAGNEKTFTFPLKSYPEIIIKVYSGIRTDTANSRGVGQDAIRVCAVNTRLNCGWIKSERVYRVEGWRNNLQSRVESVIRAAKNRMHPAWKQA